MFHYKPRFVAMKMFKTVVLFSSIIFSCLILKAQTYNPALGEANKAIRYEEFQKALNILKPLNTVESNYYLGDVYFKEGVLDSSTIFFNNAVSNNANSPFGYIGQGRIAEASGKVDEAHNLFLKAKGLLGTNYYAMLELGRAYIEDQARTKDAEASMAISILTQASGLKNKSDQVYLVLGDAYLAKQDGENTAKNYQQAMTINPNSAEPYARFARLFRFAKNRVVSLDYVDKGIAKDPNFGPIYREQAETFRASNKYNDAVNSYEKYLSLTDRSTNSRIRYIQFLFLNDNYDKANTELTSLKSSLKGDFSANPAMYRLDAISKYELGSKNKDMTLLNDGLASEKKLFAQTNIKPLAIDYTYLGKLYKATGNDSLAISTLQRALVEDSTHADEINPTLVDLYLGKKKYKEAAAIYDNKINKGDTSINNYVPFAFYTYASGDTTKFRKADDYLNRVTTRKPNYVDAWVYRGYINSSLDPELKTAAALPYFQKVIELGGTDSTFQKKIASSNRYKNFLIKSYEYVLSYHYFRKDKESAKAIALKLEALDPKNEKAEALLKQK